MKQIWNRLNSKAGETLVETMVAILIFTFGSIIMLTMISSAASINHKTEQADAQYLAEIQAVEKAETPIPGNYYVRFSDSLYGLEHSRESVPVDVYGEARDGLYAYYGKGGS